MKQETSDSVGVLKAPAFVDLPALQTDNVNAIHHAILRPVRLPESDDVDRISPFYEGVRVLPDARVSLIKRIREHTDSHQTLRSDRGHQLGPWHLLVTSLPETNLCVILRDFCYVPVSPLHTHIFRLYAAN